MAQGDVFVFDQFLVDVCEGVHDLENDDIRCAITDGTTTPTQTTPDPRWGAAGTTDFSAEESSPQTGNYTAGGNVCSNPTVTLVGGLAEIDFDDPATWAQNASNPTNARWGIVYNFTAGGKNCIGAVDLGSTFNMTTGDLQISWGAPFASLNQA